MVQGVGEGGLSVTIKGQGQEGGGAGRAEERKEDEAIGEAAAAVPLKSVLVRKLVPVFSDVRKRRRVAAAAGAVAAAAQKSDSAEQAAAVAAAAAATVIDQAQPDACATQLLVCADTDMYRYVSS